MICQIPLLSYKVVNSYVVLLKKFIIKREDFKIESRESVSLSKMHKHFLKTTKCKRNCTIWGILGVLQKVGS